MRFCDTAHSELGEKKINCADVENHRTRNCMSPSKGLHIHTSLHITAHLPMPMIPFGIRQFFPLMTVDFSSTLSLKYVSTREETLTIKIFVHFNIY